MAGAVGNKGGEAYQQLESILLRQMLQSSGAFKAGSTPGAQLRTDMFVETLADAVAKAGGLGIARMLQRQLEGPGAAAANASGGPHLGAPHALSTSATAGSLLRGSLPTGLHAPRTSTPPAALVPGAPSVGPWSGAPDSLEDPNNDAPLPEDPGADSIDSYQPAQTARGAISRGRALNTYRRRAEAPVGGSSSRASSGEEP